MQQTQRHWFSAASRHYSVAYTENEEALFENDVDTAVVCVFAPQVDVRVDFSGDGGIR